MDKGRNLYNPDDEIAWQDLTTPKIFLSHRNDDKEIVRTIARLLSALGVHYWLDEQDKDLKRAAALGMIGDAGVVHGIERGIKHCSALLGAISPITRGSWWVPYEIGFSRAADKPVGFIEVNAPEKLENPEFIRMAAVYRSVDELARWASIVVNHGLHSDLTAVDGQIYRNLAKYAPLDPPEPNLGDLLRKAIEAIDLVAKPEVQSELRLTSDKFTWMPTGGGAVRDIGYDLMAPLAYHRLELPAPGRFKQAVFLAYATLTAHYSMAEHDPPLCYEPECRNWKVQRYITPAITWRQGLNHEQASKRLDLFLTAKNRSGAPRLATKDELKAEFDRVLKAGSEDRQRSLGVLLNPLFGFTPADRPVFQRILQRWRKLYSEL